MGAFQRLAAGGMMPFHVWQFCLSLGISSDIYPRSKSKAGLAQGGGNLSPTVVSCGV